MISWNKKKFMTMGDNTTTKDATEVKGNIFLLYFLLKVLKSRNCFIGTFKKINYFQFFLRMEKKNVFNSWITNKKNTICSNGARKLNKGIFLPDTKAVASDWP